MKVGAASRWRDREGLLWRQSGCGSVAWAWRSKSSGRGGGGGHGEELTGTRYIWREELIGSAFQFGYKEQRKQRSR